MAGADEALFSHTAYDKAQTTKSLKLFFQQFGVRSYKNAEYSIF